MHWHGVWITCCIHTAGRHRPSCLFTIHVLFGTTSGTSGFVRHHQSLQCACREGRTTVCRRQGVCDQALIVPAIIIAEWTLTLNGRPKLGECQMCFTSCCSDTQCWISMFFCVFRVRVAGRDGCLLGSRQEAEPRF